jgi:hypothetical protein
MTEITERFLLSAREGETHRDHLPREQRQQKEGPDRSYYDIPMLQPPVWKWEVASYFFLGGLSSGAFLLARMADRFGGEKYREVTRIGTAVACSAFLPCAPLLIRDLGDPTRFHYMLRVFKPRSPMNLGAWVLTAFGGILSLAALSTWWKGRRKGKSGGIGAAANGTIDAITDLAGVPLALTLAGYTGVLLSTTSTPIWARNRWIGPLFSAGAISSGASARCGRWRPPQRSRRRWRWAASWRRRAAWQSRSPPANMRRISGGEPSAQGWRCPPCWRRCRSRATGPAGGFRSQERSPVWPEVLPSAGPSHRPDVPPATTRRPPATPADP